METKIPTKLLNIMSRLIQSTNGIEKAIQLDPTLAIPLIKRCFKPHKSEIQELAKEVGYVTHQDS